VPATSVACRWLAFLCPTWQRPSSSKMASMRAHSLFLLENSALASSTLLVKCLSTTCRVSVIAFFADDLSRTPYRCPPPPHTHTHTHTSDQQAADKQAWSLLPIRASFCTLAHYLLPIRTAPFTYMCLSAQVRGGETRVHAGRWHAGRTRTLIMFTTLRSVNDLSNSPCTW